MQNKYFSFVERLNYLLFIVAVCMLPYPTTASLYAWVGWLISWALELRFLQKSQLRWYKGIIPIILLAVMVIWEAISCTWAINLEEAAKMVGRHLSFLAIVLIALWGVNERYNWVKIAKYFVISCIVSIIGYAIKIYILDFWSYYQAGEGLPDFLQRWTFFGERVSIYKHHFYYGNILNLAIFSLLQIRVQKLALWRHHKTANIVFFVALMILVIGVVWSGSRANMLTLLAVGSVAVIQPLRGHTRTLVASMVCAGCIVIGALLFTLHPRFEVLEIEHITERDSYGAHEIEPRINIWYSVLQQPKDYIWHGVGAGGNSSYLTPIYQAENWNAYVQRQFNAHNQYLATLINLGIFGLIGFVLIWLLYPIWYQGRIRHFATLVAMTIGINMLTENMLDRIDGVIAVCISVLVISLLSRAQHAQ